MKLISTYDRIKAADGRCKEIVEELRKLPPMEYCVEYQRLQTRGLNQEYSWTITFIINQCNAILESEPDDVYGEEVDFRIKLAYFQERYEGIRDNIK